MAKFIEVEKFSINIDNVAYVSLGGNQENKYVLVHFIGAVELPLRIDGSNGELFLKALGSQSVDRYKPENQQITHIESFWK